MIGEFLLTMFTSLCPPWKNIKSYKGKKAASFMRRLSNIS
jgi:hypothetical protein